MPFQPIATLTVPIRSALRPLAARWECDLSDNSLRWTHGVYDMFGFPPGTRIDRRETVEMYAPESRALLERLRTAAIAEHGSFSFEACIHPLDGGARWIRVIADTVVKGGRVTHLYGSKADITATMTA